MNNNDFHSFPSVIKWLILTIIFAFSGGNLIYAQNGLEINSILNGRFSTDPKVTETYLSGNNKFLKSHNLTVFATLKAPASTYRQTVEKAVLRDGTSAIGKQVRYKGGKLYFALFILKPVKSEGVKINRYLYYLNNAANDGTDIFLVYLEGKIGEQKVSELIRKMAQNSK
ncbi:MAG: hypothetical protein HDS12_03650 [Bacteroides sp.]|nr:hypothetical protein [Bacteroides sp.]MBD5348274.1 hypothetical protein [Bacteroides sp.]